MKKESSSPMHAHQKNHNQREGNSTNPNSKVASPIPLKNSSDIPHKKQIHKKSNNNVSKLWKIFQTKQDSEKTSNKNGHYKDAIPSDNEGEIC